MIIGFDFETFRIGPGALAPEPVCLSTVVSGDPEAFQLATAADDNLEDHTNEILNGHGNTLIAANAAFDLGVIAKHWPYLVPRVFSMLEAGKIKDVQVREKLLNLAEFGEIAFAVMPDGSKRRFSYSLEELVERYLGIMVNKTKTKQGKLVGEEDAWRLNYEYLVGTKVEHWPEEAINYALEDSDYTVKVYMLQEKRRKKLKERLHLDPLATEDLRVAASFCLWLMTQNGIKIDPVEHSKIRERVAAALTPDKLDLLVKEGILRPALPPRPHARGAKAHVEGCKKKGCDCPPKMTKGTKESVNKKKLVSFVEALAKEHDIELRYTDPSDKFPDGQVKVDKEFLEDYYKLDPVLTQYRHRASLQKLVTTDLPRLEWPKGSGIAAEVVHPCYDVLKETGRTSSFASSLFPSMNGQNPHPEIRSCVVPREGYYLMSCDYSGMELVTSAQTCLNLFGYSVLADKINAGYDAHAFLGAQLAFYLDGDFHVACNEGGATTRDQIYECFLALKTSEDPEMRKMFKHYRTFAKPTGLGYPGGLGPETFCTYAHGTYGVDVDVDTAGELRKVWKETYPEMDDYLNWVNSQKDPHHDGHCYTTPLGMYRANCSFCACANGNALQSPAAEGAIMAVCNVLHETMTDGSVLSQDAYGIRHRPLMFIHDEIVSEVRIDVAHECAQRISEIMVEALRIITPDVKVVAEPCLMTRWNKRAEAVYDSSGRLVPWEPKEQE